MGPFVSRAAHALPRVAVLLCAAGCGCGAADAIQRDAAGAARGEVRVIVTLAEKVDLAPFQAEERRVRAAHVARALREKADTAQGPLRAFLRDRGGKEMVALPIVNGLAVTVRAEILPELMSFPGVERVTLDAVLAAPPVTYGTGAAPEWNLTAIRAPDLWGLGFRGAGVVVANMDTGVDLGHADLRGSWRGGANDWFDPFAGTAAPYDAIGHGTQTMGILVGGDAGGTQIGVAPDATWIAAKIYDDAGTTRVSVVHRAFQWLLDPDGDPSTADAPDVVDASWGMDAVNACDLTFQADLDALRSAGILVVIAAGNSGPLALTSVSPANNPGAFSAGAVDAARQVAMFSSRGPSACTGEVFPDVVGPGVGVRTADLSLGGVPQYAIVSGTSYAAPHVAGAAALLMGGLPHPTVAAVEEALRASALDLGPAGPDGAYGHGLVDVYGAYFAAIGSSPVRVVTASLRPATTDAWYEETLRASGGTEPYAWSLAAGELPPGLGLHTSTGVIAGEPEVTRISRFTVRVTDALGAVAERAERIVVIGADLDHDPPRICRGSRCKKERMDRHAPDR